MVARVLGGLTIKRFEPEPRKPVGRVRVNEKQHGGDEYSKTGGDQVMLDHTDLERTCL